MPPKRGTKRKQRARGNANASTRNGEAAPSPPNRESWPGWVEMESEPVSRISLSPKFVTKRLMLTLSQAFFNVMLRELGVYGVRVQEIFSMDEQDLLLLPRPVHALIFLFRYAAGNDEGTGTDCPDHVWFANQIPDFACGTVALLNIVNNIPDLKMGRELREFKETTQEMNPLLRGTALESFEFLRKVHNSFARESDMLHADTLLRDKVNQLKRKQAAAKARETKAANNKTPLKPKPANVTATPSRSSQRVVNANSNDNGSSTKKRRSPDTNDTPSNEFSDPPDTDPDFTVCKKRKLSAGAADRPSASPTPAPTRRSTRKPQPRKKTLAEETDPTSGDTASAEADKGGAFHFIAYMPIQDSVYKMDGLDSYPERIGTFDASAGEDWMSIAEPVLRTRMALHAAGGIEFNLMAVVHDPLTDARRELAGNVKALRVLDGKLDEVFEDWRELEGAGTPGDVIVGKTHSLLELGICEGDVEEAEIGPTPSACASTSSTSPPGLREEIEKEEDLLKLVELRAKVIKLQAPLRGAVRDALAGARNDDEEARHRRYDYGSFVKGWLGALADNELLTELLADE